MSSRCKSRVEVADDVSPFAGRGERDRARPLANGQAFDGLERNIGLSRETLAKRFEQAGAHWALVGLAGDADEQRRGGGTSRYRRSWRQSEPANDGFGAKAEVCRVVMNAPWPPLRRPCGIHRRTAGLLACGVSPTPPSRTFKKSSGEKSVGTPLTVAGAATDQPKGLPCSLFTLGRNRGTVLEFMSQLREGLSNGAQTVFEGSEAG